MSSGKAVFFGGPWDGTCKAVRDLKAPISASTFAGRAGDFDFGPVGTLVELPVTKMYRYWPHTFCHAAATEHVDMRVEAIAYTLDESLPPDLDWGRQKQLAAAARLTVQLAPCPDFLTDFEGWFRWQCFYRNAPLDWVRDERVEVIRAFNHLQYRWGYPEIDVPLDLLGVLGIEDCLRLAA